MVLLLFNHVSLRHRDVVVPAQFQHLLALSSLRIAQDHGDAAVHASDAAQHQVQMDLLPFVITVGNHCMSVQEQGYVC